MSRKPLVVTSAGWAPLFVITAFVVTVVPWNSVRTCAASRPSSRTPSMTPRSKRGGVEGTLATRDSPDSLTAKTSVNVPPVSQPTIQFISRQGEGDAAVHEQHLACDVGGLLAGEEEEGVRDVLGLAVAA